ncbi:MAG: hypothetical protein QOG62_2436 [Thermoleophilaceae bacterium]|nr:hypothetical protein [Thermoleophilaceae bacterium]
MAIAITVAAAAGVPASALAGIDREVRGLQRSACPVTYEALHQRTYNLRTEKRAMRWRFAVTDRKFRVNLRPPISWGHNELGSKSYKAKLHALGYLDVLFYIYGNSPDFSRPAKIRALQNARDIVLDFIKSNPVHGDRVANKAWINKVTGDRVGYVAYLTRAAECEHLLNREQRTMLIASLGVHGRHLERGRVYSPSNHGLSVDLGLGLLARYAPFIAGADRWDALSQRRFRLTLLHRLQTTEGVWEEHSPEYQILVTKVLDTFVRATDPEDRLLVTLLGRMRRAAAAFVMPDGTFPQFGDTERQPVKEDLREASMENNVEALIKYVGSGQALTDGVQGQLPESVAGLLGVSQGLISFPKSGYAIVKEPSTSSYLAVESAFHNLSHKHADELSFELFDHGYRVVSDTGLYNKDQNRFYTFQRSAQAHSTLTVDDQDFRLKRKDAYGSGIEATGTGVAGWYGIRASNPLVKRQGVTHQRTFLYKPGEALVVIDRVGADKPHQYDRRFQLGPDLSIKKVGGALAFSAGAFHGELYNAPGTRGSRTRTVRGNPKTLEGFTFPSFRKKDPRWTVDFQTRERNAIHVTTFSLDSAHPVRAELPSGGDGSSVDLYTNGHRTSTLTTLPVGSGAMTVVQTPSG